MSVTIDAPPGHADAWITEDDPTSTGFLWKNGQLCIRLLNSEAAENAFLDACDRYPDREIGTALEVPVQAILNAMVDQECRADGTTNSAGMSELVRAAAELERLVAEYRVEIGDIEVMDDDLPLDPIVA